ncbi:MAG TPA: phage tail tape measure protein, partial [Desulfitobacterium dehalogenans]|nr:phage tail tape measure protein [Desulfitobacterium dehalogenans]
MQAVTSQFDKNDKSQEALTAQNQVLNKQIDAQKQKISELQKGLTAAAEKYGENDKVTQGWQQSVNKATADLNKMESELLSNNEAIKNYGKAQLEAVKNSEEFKAAQEKLGGILDVVKKAAIAAGTAIVGLMAGGAKAAIEYESAFAGVRKTVDATEEEFAQLNQGIRDMSKNMPQSATDIAAVAEAAGQLGIQTDNILGFTKTMVMLGDATNMSSDEAATALARLANITQMPQGEFDKLGSTIVALGNNLATTESEIVAMGLRLAGAGKQIGLSEAQVLSFAGALSSVGIEAEAGGSAFSRVMVDMQLAVETNSKRLNDFAGVAGMTASEFKKAFKEDAAGALIAFITGLGNAESQGTSAIKVLDDMGIAEIRLRDALLRASGAGDLFSDSIKLGTEAWQENVALTNEAEQRYSTTESQINMLKNTIKDIGIEIGEKLLPTIKDMTQRLKEVDTEPIVSGFTWVINNAGNIATAAATIGAAMLTWKVYSTVFTLVKAVMAYKEALVAAQIAQQGLNIAMKANIIGLIITAVAAL